MVSKDLRRDLDAVQSKIRVGFDGVYWKAVMVCQLKVISRPFAKFVNVMPKSSCRQTPVALYNRAAITALFKRLRQRASARSCFVNGLPIISNWQNGLPINTSF